MTRVTTAAAEKVVEIKFRGLYGQKLRAVCSASTTLRVALNDAAELKGVKLEAAVLVGPNSQIALGATPESVFGDGLLDGDGELRDLYRRCEYLQELLEDREAPEAEVGRKAPAGRR